MTTIDFKPASELAKSFAPTDELKSRFYQTFFGSLFGYTILLIGLLLIYVAAIRRLGAVLRKTIFDIYAAMPSSWNTPRMAARSAS
jgi:hypothetical protein